MHGLKEQVEAERAEIASMPHGFKKDAVLAAFAKLEAEYDLLSTGSTTAPSRRMDGGSEQTTANTTEGSVNEISPPKAAVVNDGPTLPKASNPASAKKEQSDPVLSAVFQAFSPPSEPPLPPQQQQEQQQTQRPFHTRDPKRLDVAAEATQTDESAPPGGIRVRARRARLPRVARPHNIDPNCIDPLCNCFEGGGSVM